MKLWIGGILDVSIADVFREIRNEIQRAINLKIEDEEYGSGISTWDVVLVVLESKQPKEHTRVAKASRETDIRILIDYSAFLCGSTKQREELLQKALLESIHRLSQKRIPDFNSLKLQKDVSGIFNLPVYS
jgi:uncharacterized protein YbbC (DUF1343 family)